MDLREKRQIQTCKKLQNMIKLNVQLVMLQSMFHLYFVMNLLSTLDRKHV